MSSQRPAAPERSLTERHSWGSSVWLTGTVSSDPDRFARSSGPGPRTDWVAWHGAYDSTSSSLSRRVEVVRRRLSDMLSNTSTATTVLSLCAGDGRDVLGVNPRGVSARAVLVELDPELARRASKRAAGLPWVEVRCGDASDVATFIDVVPVDVLMLCGVFGNVDPQEVRAIIDRVALLLQPGGTVIWTRGGGDPDRRPEVRTAFIECGFDEVTFDGAPERFGVGVSRLTRPTPSGPELGVPLFTFVR